MKQHRLSQSQRALRHYLAQGGVIAYATRAVFGLGCSPYSQRGLKKLLSIKKRPSHKGLIVIAHQARELQKLHHPLTATEQNRVNQAWPGPVTFLVPARQRCLPLVRGRHKSKKVAVRVDAHPDTLTLLRTIKMPITSTSANLSGRRPIRTLRECHRQLGNKVKIISGRTLRHTQPSKIIDLANDQIIRR
ncbi:L-threonylcarbamoyladenylate synthase [Ferrovum sp. PN-J185]|uniref:L-threonylcarbamoyladenylate synthase n=1 Tax=Ferrovum sp. PN-J185 TaxID=1356306 RepID=UPI000792A7EC|nr:L-threonylcarbamoyladenylate synthase [Ferrovum sp. PN-J185]KXW55529.1 threonylcarbamoyl-AMP synthase [Ferrovum sp. PN-J185]MCC6067914.1 L-threonylcarbamoyladenylate synthase [Ferrovum sp. PN-J185]MDE1891257.1 L-threonylcarbamoyladenylate synthase [Betaproteobacteria bacterium]MDE2056297.1 L-threonylcarbamoyladenylate synthase [Betaproteobacteria bacterium]